MNVITCKIRWLELICLHSLNLLLAFISEILTAQYVYLAATRSPRTDLKKIVLLA
jgi:hypothetical protein